MALAGETAGADSESAHDADAAHGIPTHGTAAHGADTDASMIDSEAEDFVAREFAAQARALAGAAAAASSRTSDPSNYPGDDTDSRGASAIQSPRQRRTLAALLGPSTPAANDDREALAAESRAGGNGFLIGAALATAAWMAALGLLYIEPQLSNPQVIIAALALTGVYSMVLLALSGFFRQLESQANMRGLIRAVSKISTVDAGTSDRAESVAHAVKQEMASVDQALDRTLARAAQLERLLKSEYLDFERSFADNEQRLRTFLDTMSSERAAIVTNAEKVRSAIAGAHQNLSRDLDEASDRFARLVGEASMGLAQTIDHKSEELAKAAASASDRCAARLDSALEGSIIRASDLVETRGDKFAALLSSRGNELDERLSARMKEASDLLERQIKDAQDKASFRIDAMATQIDKLLKKMDNGIGERGDAINAMLATRTIEIAKTLKETGQDFRDTLDRTTVVADDFVKKAHTINVQLDQQVTRLSSNVVEPLEAVTADLDEKGRALSATLADRFAAIDNMLSLQTNRLSSVLDREFQTLKLTLDSSTEAIKGALGDGSSELKGSVADRAQKIEAVLSERLAAFSALITENRQRLAFELASHTQSLEHLLDRQRTLLTDLAEPRPSESRAPEPRATITAPSTSSSATAGALAAARAISERKSVFASPSAPQLNQTARELPPRPSFIPTRQPSSSTGPLRDRLAAIENMQTSTPARQTSGAVGSAAVRAAREPVRPTTLAPSQPAPAASMPSRAAIAAPSPRFGSTAPSSLSHSSSSHASSSHASAAGASPTATSLAASVPATPGKSLLSGVASGSAASTGKTWLSDLLARASIDEEGGATSVGKANYQDAPISSIAANVGAFIKPDELQRSWERYNSGVPGDFQNIYTPKGAVMQLKIKQRLVEDAELRQAVNSYVTEFERLLQEVHEDGGDEMIFEYLHTDAGKVYTMLAHASNRLGASA